MVVLDWQLPFGDLCAGALDRGQVGRGEAGSSQWMSRAWALVHHLRRFVKLATGSRIGPFGRANPPSAAQVVWPDETDQCSVDESGGGPSNPKLERPRAAGFIQILVHVLRVSQVEANRAQT